MAELKGTNIAAPIVPFTDQDIFATHEAQYGKGGYRTVKEISDLDKIPEPRLEEGMIVYVINDPSGIHNYQYLKDTNGKFGWAVSRVSSGIPIYTNEYAKKLGIDTTKETGEQYIVVPDIDTDLNGKVEQNTYKTTVNGTYVDVLFRAIRALQSEVAKLKNSFQFGIESYTDENTAMSNVMDELSNTEEEEPMWAVMEGSMSSITEGLDTDWQNVTIRAREDGSKYYEATAVGTWTAGSDVLSCTDSKIYIYSTVKTTGETIPKITYYLISYDPTNSNSVFHNFDLNIPISTIKLSDKATNGIYNVLLVISRSQEIDSEYKGKNFLWVSIGDGDTNETLASGYWDPSTQKLSNKCVEIYNVSKEKIDAVDANDIDTKRNLEIQNRYNIASIAFDTMTVYKFDVYSKWEDFSNNVIPSAPSDQDYKFKAAHITIRSVKSYDVLEKLKDQVLNNELIYVEANNQLWIKTNGNLRTISASGGNSNPGKDDDNTMTEEELYKYLTSMGIVKNDNGELSVNSLSDITFINSDTGNKYKFYTDAEGNLRSDLIQDSSTTIENRIKAIESRYTPQQDVRGLIGNLKMAENQASFTSGKDTDARLCSDRLKIGAIYAPLKSDLAHGCSHSYVELENTSDSDINLTGCYLHYTKPDAMGDQVVYHLPLTGTIYAGSTYLIRGARHAEYDDPNVYIKVKDYDQEWYVNGSLIDFTIYDTMTTGGYGFALTYGNADLSTTTQLVTLTSTLTSTVTIAPDGVGNKTITVGANQSKTNKKFPYLLDPSFIDGLYIYRAVTNPSGAGYWASSAAVSIVSNSLYRNTFELDPAKQAFQAFSTYDSSRARWANSGNDYQVVRLGKEYIEFPHTDEKMEISKYTPKASTDKKNVCTDKSKINHDKPNMVTVGFGNNAHTTRTFNWISAGYYPEYVWIKKDSDTNWLGRFQSYQPIHKLTLSNVAYSNGSTTATVKLASTAYNGSNLNGYDVLLDSTFKDIVVIDGSNNKINTSTLTLSGDQTSIITSGSTYYLRKSDDDAKGTTYPMRKNFDAEIIDTAYARISSRFPADNTHFTSHKVIVDVLETAPTAKTKYVYVVGRADKNGNPDPDHTSGEQSFTIYPTSASPKIYQITDQQGFHWIEYQVWAAAAEKILEKIEYDLSKDSNIMPILLNTGDMTQNGTRINEWLDYYNAGKCLFERFEQVNVVGNNDLCDIDHTALGTGDDRGKSSPYFYNLLYCNEIGGTLSFDSRSEVFEPIINNVYVPSFFYVDFCGSNRLLLCNSEITETTCINDYGEVTSDGKAINIYTGYVVDSSANGTYVSTFTPIYTMVWRILKDAKAKSLSVIAACHEMPFTVITNKLLKSSTIGWSRCYSDTDGLVGSHMNQISIQEGNDTKNAPGVYWFSRLLEYFRVKLVLGGHKHTYSLTYPVREQYLYTKNGGTVNSFSAGPMEMAETLEGDTVNFKDTSTSTTRDLSKFPLVNRTWIGSETPSSGFYPMKLVQSSNSSDTNTYDAYSSSEVVYFMCQATGYKLTSNKELPSENQTFSNIIPHTTVDAAGSDSADKNQKYPMFATVTISSNSYKLCLARISHIMVSGKFNQTTYETSDMKLQWISQGSNSYGSWSGDSTTDAEPSTPLITVNK